MRGIDISQGSGGVDFQLLKKDGFDFVICRAGYGSSINQKDSKFDEYVLGAKNAGLHVGAYWFIYARSRQEAIENGRAFCAVCERYKGVLDMPLYIDYENESTRYYEQETKVKEDKQTATDFVLAACAEVEQNDWYSGYYVNLDYLKNHVNANALTHYALWLALWRDVKSVPETPCGIWQYSGDTKTQYAGGGIDLDLSFVDYPTAIKRHGLNGFTPDIDFDIGCHSIYGQAIKINANGTWEFV